MSRGPLGPLGTHGLGALALLGAAAVAANACSRHPAAPAPPVTPGAVAADHPLASEAGANALRMGGNAVDAAVAAALTSGVVQPSGSGLGGGGFAVVVAPGKDPLVLDFREVAPAAATRDMFLGGASSQVGGLAVAVPSEGIGLAELHRRYGRLPAADVAEVAILHAERGFETGPHLADALDALPEMGALFEPGNRRPRLAEALKAWAETGGEAFRSGWVAQDFVDAARAAGGLLTMDDLRGYAVKERAPLVGSYAGHTIVTMPPPSSGGVALLQMLGATGATTSVHCQVEAAKHAMADRAAFGGDPDFVPYDAAALLDPEVIDAIRSDCGPTTFPPDHYTPGPGPVEDAGTLHVSAMDASGMAVALTTTINTAFGSRVIARKSGIVLNNEMDDFTTRPGQPNAFGLLQGEENAVGPGKRPLSSMTPTVVLDAGGAPVFAVGASGGPFIVTSTFQVLRAVLAGAEPHAAVSAPRWHHQWQPDVAFLEAGHPARDELVAAGHAIKDVRGFSSVQAVLRRDGRFLAASDPRKHGVPSVVE